MVGGGAGSGSTGLVKILLDMNLTPRWVQTLEPAGFEAVHWAQVGRHNAPDEEIMSYAAERGFVVLTHDLDFSAILASTKGRKPSVVQIRATNISPETSGPTVLAALRETSEELEAGALVTIDGDRTRLRVLPLQSNT